MPPVRRSKRLRQSLIGVPSPATRRRDHSPNHNQAGRSPKAPQAHSKLEKARAGDKPSYLHRTTTELNRDPNLHLRLFDLPREIFDEIISYLTPIGVASLSLTCKTALGALGTASWAHLGPSTRPYYQRDDLSLQALIQKDNPALTLCYRCNVLHPPIKPPATHRMTKWTRRCLGPGAFMDYWPLSGEGGYRLAYEHIEEVFASKPKGHARGKKVGNAPLARTMPVDLLTGDFTTKLPTGSGSGKGAGSKVTYRLASSAYWINDNLVLKQEHRLSSSGSKSSSALQAGPITSLPLRVCAHLTTSTAPTPESQRTSHHEPNGSLLTRAIVSAFPVTRRGGLAPESPDTFRDPCPSEKRQIDSGSGKKDFIWSCRACPTKFRVNHNPSTGELVVTAWHCFGKGLPQAKKYWKWFVRRENLVLGPKNRNSEYYVFDKSVPDFLVEWDEGEGTFLI
ncbi:hypothetical protein BDW69DRAFT_175983 [Aspergillus filifer]